MFYYNTTDVDKIKKWSDSQYPLTIVADRYSGTYSQGLFVAWPCHPEDVPYQSQSDDCSCADFWAQASGSGWLYGVGDSVGEAHFNLVDKFRNKLFNVEEQILINKKPNKHSLRCSVCGRFISEGWICVDCPH